MAGQLCMIIHIAGLQITHYQIKTHNQEGTTLLIMCFYLIFKLLKIVFLVQMYLPSLPIIYLSPAGRSEAQEEAFQQNLMLCVSIIININFH